MSNTDKIIFINYSPHTFKVRKKHLSKASVWWQNVLLSKAGCVRLKTRISCRKASSVRLFYNKFDSLQSLRRRAWTGVEFSDKRKSTACPISCWCICDFNFSPQLFVCYLLAIASTLDTNFLCKLCLVVKLYFV